MGNSLALDTQSFHPAFKQWIVWWMAISHNNGSSQWCQAHQEQVVPFFLLRKSETNPWPLTSVPRQNISHASNTNTCFHLNEYKYMIKQPAKNPPPKEGSYDRLNTHTSVAGSHIQMYFALLTSHDWHLFPDPHIMPAQESSDLEFSSFSQ